MATSGRGDYIAAIMVWRWRDQGMMARALAHRLPVGFTPEWVAVCPPTAERPAWVPAGALRFPLHDDDLAFVW